jgi:hypothetical protein
MCYNYDYWDETFLSFSKFNEHGNLISQNKHLWINPEEYETRSPVSMDVYDTKTFESEIILYVTALQPGLYLLTIVANKEQITKKIIK